MTTRLRRDLTPAAGLAIPKQSFGSVLWRGRRGRLLVPTTNAQVLTISRALVSACGGAFDLEPGLDGGVVARIALPATLSTSAAL